jgi:hypothetical protein
MRTNYVLIDLENLTPASMHLLAQDHFQVRVFVGESQKRVPIELAGAMQPLGSNAQYVQINGSGPNALDFHIAYYIGRLSMESPGAFFHIISKDKGFDPLIRHLKEQKVFCLRHSTLTDIPLVRHANSSLAEKVDGVIAKVIGATARPKTAAALRRRIDAALAKALSDEQIEEVVRELRERGLIKEDAGKLIYTAPDPER